VRGRVVAALLRTIATQHFRATPGHG